MIVRLLFLTALAAAALAALFYSQTRREPFHVSGVLEADEIRLGSRVGGRVARVAVEEGQTVEAGDLLVSLEPYDLRHRRAEAVAELERRRAAWSRLQAGFRVEEKAEAVAQRDRLQADYERLKNGPRSQEIAAAAARHTLARHELELAQVKHARIEAAFKREAVTPTELDEAIRNLRVAEQTVEVRRAEHNLLLAGTRAEELAAAQAALRESEAGRQLRENGYRVEEIAEAQAAVDAAQAALAALDDSLAELEIRAPTRAVVEAIELQPGDLISPNAPAVSLLSTQRLWVRAYVPENRLDLAVGQAAWVTVDSFPGESFRARFSFVSRQAEFTPGNVQTPEERSKQVFRVKAQLDDGQERLRAGMAADLWLEEPAP